MILEEMKLKKNRDNAFSGLSFGSFRSGLALGFSFVEFFYCLLVFPFGGSSSFPFAAVANCEIQLIK